MADEDAPRKSRITGDALTSALEDLRNYDFNKDSDDEEAGDEAEVAAAA